ncbi:acyl-CoA thioesterase [uncultured Jatrophihabitans sp.]|uniref:acyl-CoA thioesterase n=1 Tax=uncultured Jatrophihabitans sp. TaxID=1610747 RepID=UPI0035CC2065
MNVVDPDGGGPLTVTIERRVEFADTDATGHHHYLAVLRWLEHAERVLHEQLGIADETLGRLPRVHLEVDFFAAVHYREPIELTLVIERVGRTSLTHSFRVESGALLVAAGRYVVVLSAAIDGRSTPWPAEVRDRLSGTGTLPGERTADLPPSTVATVAADTAAG